MNSYVEKLDRICSQSLKYNWYKADYLLILSTNMKKNLICIHLFEQLLTSMFQHELIFLCSGSGAGPFWDCGMLKTKTAAELMLFLLR